MRNRIHIRSPFLVVLALLLAACAASTSIVNQWALPDPGPAMKKIFVIGMLRDASVRRTFEDAMVASLKARGVEAVPAYAYVDETVVTDAAALAAAAQKSGATGVLFARVLKVDRQTTLIATGPAYWGPPVGFGAWYPGAWGPVYAYPYPPPLAPTVQAVTSDTVYGEVRLYRVAGETMVWAATTETFNPTNPAKDSAQFAQVITAQLAQKGLI